jgi:DTW domain-containing protein YfiP
LDNKKIESSRDRERASLALDLPVEEQAHRMRVVILQHPQEPDKVLGTAPLCVRALAKAELKVGLSWPSFSKMLGTQDMPSEWGVLYLGSKDKKYSRPVNVLDKKLNVIEPPPFLKGIVVLDGTWSQAKTLWWRNPWLLKLRRVVIQPDKPSRYGNLRKEPRPEAVSTIEAVAMVLRDVEGNPHAAEYLEQAFERMLETFRANRRS